jgi:hypothetical protein
VLFRPGLIALFLFYVILRGLIAPLKTPTYKEFNFMIVVGRFGMGG